MRVSSFSMKKFQNFVKSSPKKEYKIELLEYGI